MNNKQTMSKMTALAMAATLALAACGGGAGDSSSTPAAPASGASGPSAPVTPTSGIALQTTVPAPTYAADSFQNAAFAIINNYRSAMGVGMLKQDTVLDTSAQAHALYQFSNIKDGTLLGVDHTEIAGNANYYGDTPLSRAQKAGAATSEWIAENVAQGGLKTTGAAAAADCIRQLMNTVYHLAAMTGNQESIGIGYSAGDVSAPFYTCVTDFGTSMGVVGSPATNSIPYAGGQIIPPGTVVHSPYANESSVAIAMNIEAPNPAPDLAAPGRPILVSVNAQNGDALTVRAFTLVDSSGASVPARILVPASAQAGSTATTVADPNSDLRNGNAVLLPLQPLKANTTYTVAFAGARDGMAVTSTWDFTTAAN
ncbi:CAP domain-containing protein [Caballeronia sp. 15711]|uniref:CAP domain-containing protein n=1 Tax=Caballeronia sp. 15711 TaxID=3391029 RepID=UPI0039E3460F